MSHLDSEHLKLMINVANQYYKEGMTQEQISKRLHISRSMVSKLLVKGREMGLIEVVIHEDHIHIYHELEERLKHIFSLKYVTCVEVEEGKSEYESVAEYVGKFLASKLTKVNTVTVSGGRMMYEVAMYFVPNVSLDHLTFVPMVGGVSDEEWKMQANTVCEYFARHTNGSSLLFHAPVVVDSKEAKEMLMRQRFIQQVIEKARKSQIALVGIGTGKRYLEIAENYLPEDQCKIRFMKEKIKGDIIFNYYDDKGNLIDCPWNEQNMCLSLEELKQIPEVIAIACGIEKAESILIAMKKKYINSLIITVPLAKQILKLI